jgi:hypothetical protein
MTALNHATRRRLQKLHQTNSVWEGDRRLLSTDLPISLESDSGAGGECILWVDGSEGVVRAMDVVTPETGPEAIARTLLRAMEHPHSPARPARPQKIVVQDREIQFFLRGVLQDLDIAIDYVPELPLIDEIFRGFQDVVNTRPPELPPQYAEALEQVAFDIWEDAPWDLLEEQQILTIELNRWDIGTLYASVLGMLGMEYGILLYRSLESLKRFRQRVLNDESIEQLEEAFLGQDCLFLTFETVSEAADEDEDLDLADLPIGDIQPSFGTLHPLEGLRAFLYDEEAIALLVALEALHRFFRQHGQKLAGEDFPAINSRYRISVPQAEDPQQVPVKVATLPELAAELMEMVELAEAADDDLPSLPLLRDDLVPKNSFLSLGMMPWEMVELLRVGVEHYPATEAVPVAGDGLPIVMIQTTRPKAKTLIQDLQAAGGLKAICFNPGEDPLGGDRYDLGLLQTENDELHLFGEFMEDDPTHIAARKKWDQRCKKTKGYCGLVIAMGLTGASRGQPQLKDMMALFEVRSLSAKELGLGTLQLIPQLE